MTEAAATAAERRPGAERPGWWWTLGVLILGGLLSIPLLLALQWGLEALHVVPDRHLDDGTSRGGAWPWPRTDAWSVLAGLGPQLLCGYAYALGILLVARWLGWRARMWMFAAPVVLLGAPPWGRTEGAIAVYLVLWVIARQWAIRRDVGTRWWRRSPRAAIAAAAATSCALAAVTLSYQALHPIAVDTSRAGTINGRVPPWLWFTLDVEGVAGAEILSVRAQIPFDDLRFHVRIDDPHLLGRKLSHGDEIYGAVTIAPPVCRRGPALATPQELLVRVRVLGRTRTQTLPLDGAPPVRCSRRERLRLRASSRSFTPRPSSTRSERLRPPRCRPAAWCPRPAPPTQPIRLAPGLCRDGGGHRAEVRGLELQVETLGMLRAQRFMRDLPVTLHCPADGPG